MLQRRCVLRVHQIGALPWHLLLCPGAGQGWAASWQGRCSHAPATELALCCVVRFAAVLRGEGCCVLLPLLQ